MEAAEMKALAEAHFQECQFTSEFLAKRVRPRIDSYVERTSPSREAITFHGLLLRAKAWMGTLAKLNSMSDFQAVVSASRALFEIAVDTTLMQCEPDVHPPEKMAAWDESARLKAALRVAEYGRAGGLPPDVYEVQSHYLATQRARIEQLPRFALVAAEMTLRYFGMYGHDVAAEFDGQREHALDVA